MLNSPHPNPFSQPWEKGLGDEGEIATHQLKPTAATKTSIALIAINGAITPPKP
jgi:hypothetical protein